MINPDVITAGHARDLYEVSGGMEDWGSIVIEGYVVDWWADHRSVWFYNPGDDGDNTIKRFTADVTFREDKG